MCLCRCFISKKKTTTTHTKTKTTKNTHTQTDHHDRQVTGCSGEHNPCFTNGQEDEDKKKQQ